MLGSAGLNPSPRKRRLPPLGMSRLKKVTNVFRMRVNVTVRIRKEEFSEKRRNTTFFRSLRQRKIRRLEVRMTCGMVHAGFGMECEPAPGNTEPVTLREAQALIYLSRAARILSIYQATQWPDSLLPTTRARSARSRICATRKFSVGSL